MKPNQNHQSSNWSKQNNKPSYGNDYLSHKEAEYLTPGQKGFSNSEQNNWLPNFKENKPFSNWGKPNNLNNKFHTINEGGFRSNTGQYNNSNENHKGPSFLNLNNHSKIRSSYFDEEETLLMKIEEQEFEFSKLSNVPQNFKLEYVEFDNLPHISQINPAMAKYSFLGHSNQKFRSITTYGLQANFRKYE